MQIPDFSQPFVIECDASGSGVGAVLIQNNHPVAYLAKMLAGKSKLLFACDRELLALVLAVTKWRHYLLGSTLEHTDHESLKYVWEQQISTTQQQKWLPKLIAFTFSIVYKQGKMNTAADTLSRRQEELAIVRTCTHICMEISVVISSWLNTIIEEYSSNDKLQSLIQSHLKGFLSNALRFKDNELYFKG